ncbi:serine/threonine-protein kinase [Nonomuraea zeae]|uniref:serine/threonine-protein kinase n=1 Tax=Nonomuraea zeae TaxID=1642303 RepID=UPI0014786255|nr:serine/threonine-protein kinase [Nonomuraea zeae]
MVADRYRLDELIGHGPMGEVWRGYDTRADWVVAVKVLGAKAAGAATREVLRQHAQAVARVIHPNVAMVLDVGDRDGAPFIVTEYLTGLSLGEELAAQGGPLRVVDVCDLVGQAAAGLDAAHRAGVVHGQVGPDSFRRAGSGVLKVVGFGMDDREPPARDGRYVAPERVAGQKAQAPGDLYALGCVCYELLCGRPAFDAQTPGAGPGAATEARSGAGLEGASDGGAGDTPRAGAGDGEAASSGGEADSGGAAGSSGGAAGSFAGAPGSSGGAAGRPDASGGRRDAPAPPSTYRPEVSPELDRLVLAMIAEDPARRPASGETIRRALAAIARPRVNPGANPGVQPVTGASLRDPGLAAGARAGAAGASVPGVGAGAGAGAGATEVYQFGGSGTRPGPAARAGDTAIFQSSELDAQPPSSNRKLFLQLGAAVAVIAVVTVGMVLWAGSGGKPVAVTTPSVVPTSAPVSSEPLPTPSSSGDPSQGLVTTIGPGTEPPTSLNETVAPKATLGDQIPPGGWSRWLEAFDEALTAQEAMGGINPSVAAKAHDKIRKAGRKFQEGHGGPEVGQIAGIYRDLQRAQQKGDMNATGPLSEFLREWRLPNG